MKYTRRIISLLAALAVTVSFTSCSKEVPPLTESEPEVTEPVVTDQAEAPAPPEEKGQEYKLSNFYERTALSDFSSLTGKVTDTLYGGDHMYVLTDDVAYSSGTGFRMCNIELASMQRSELYNSPEGYVFTADTPDRLPEDFTLAETDELYGVYPDRVMYKNERGVCVKDIKSGREIIIDRPGSTEYEVCGAFYDGKKYVIVYQDKPMVLKHFYITNADGEVTEETKMTLGFDGKIENAYVTSKGELFFTKVVREVKTTPGAAGQVPAVTLPPVTTVPAVTTTVTEEEEEDDYDEYEDEDAKVAMTTQAVTTKPARPTPDPTAVQAAGAETTKIEIYRLRPDGSLNRVVAGENIPYRRTVDDFFASADGDVFILENDPVNGRTMQRFDANGIRTANMFLTETPENEKFFCHGSDLWLAWSDEDGTVSLASVSDTGEADTGSKITTDIGGKVSVLAGDGFYNAYISDRSSVYGVDLAGKSCTEIMNWTDADADIPGRDCIGVKDAGDIYCISQETNEETGEVTVRPVRLAKANEQRLAEINSKRIITVAGDIFTNITVNGMTFDIPEKIREFNRTNDQYFIHPRNYINSENGASDASAAGARKLEEDINGGFTPDFIIYNPADNDFSSLAENGKFAEIRDLMTDDPEVTEEDLMENIVEFCTENDVMYRIFPSFRAKTFVVSESETESTKPWKLSEYLDTAGVSNTVYQHEVEAFEDLFSGYAAEHTDFRNKSCDFKNSDFIDLLRWADNFLSVEEALERYGTDYVDEKVYPVRSVNISTPARFNYEEAVTAEETVIKGIPSDNGAGLEIIPGLCFSVLKTSDAKQASWQFIRQFFTEEFYGWGIKMEYTEDEMMSHINPSELPVRKSVLEKLIDDSTSLKFEHMLYGDDYVPMFSAWGSEYELPEISKSTADKFRSALKQTAFLSIADTEYFRTIAAEAEKYFTDPEMTSEEAADNVQRAATAYLLSKN